ncbi:MAG: hypothetical protein A4E73_00476 [Syntrophaceae bacterium PtaU1.Bin231]|nr:MAG: hypothetical protein A4E73_00476 [Syntrophaceae bacterium PtaU1.Bin231]
MILLLKGGTIVGAARRVNEKTGRRVRVPGFAGVTRRKWNNKRRGGIAASLRSSR